MKGRTGTTDLPGAAAADWVDSDAMPNLLCCWSLPGHLQRRLGHRGLVIDQGGELRRHRRRPALLDLHLVALEGADDVVLAPVGVEVEEVEAPVRASALHAKDAGADHRLADLDHEALVAGHVPAGVEHPRLRYGQVLDPLLEVQHPLQALLQAGAGAGDAVELADHLLEVGHEGERVLALAVLPVLKWLQEDRFFGLDLGLIALPELAA